MNKELLNSTIYQIYVRNYTKEGTFKSLISKLEYIKGLGIDIIQLLPINTIGSKGRKGTLGSPYAIKDYYEINPELGTLKDLEELLKSAHKLDLKVILDVVFNHTSRDSVLINQHNDFYYRNKNNELSNKVGDWSDVYDLDYNNENLIEYVTEVLEYYTKLGFDGFRFDVASLLPNSFYKIAIPRIRNINKEAILLGEAIEPDFAQYLKEVGAVAISDSELYFNGFDLLYRYSNFNYLRKYLENNDELSLNTYKESLLLENANTPSYGLKIGTIENHDCPRIASYSEYDPLRKNLVAFSFFLKGTGFVFGGEESKETKLPSLFDKDVINLEILDDNYFNFVKKMISFKKDIKNQELIISKILDIKGNFIVVENIYKNQEKEIGFFNFSENPTIITSDLLQDGAYLDKITNKEIIIKNKTIKINEPLILSSI